MHLRSLGWKWHNYYISRGLGRTKAITEFMFTKGETSHFIEYLKQDHI